MSTAAPPSRHPTAANATESIEPTSVSAPSPLHAVLLPYLLGLLTAFTLAGAGIFVLRRPDPPPIQVMAPPTPAPTQTAAPTATPGPIVVYVSGAVAAPGTFTLAPEARIVDAIAAAGGLRTDADSAQVNQAQHLFDGAQVHVPVAGAAPVGRRLIWPAANAHARQPCSHGRCVRRRADRSQHGNSDRTGNAAGHRRQQGGGDHRQPSLRSLSMIWIASLASVFPRSRNSARW
jgi:hypothetical protein